MVLVIGGEQQRECPAISLASSEPYGAQLSEYDTVDPEPERLLVSAASPFFQKF